MYGVIDIGSNTIRFVIYKVENNRIKSLLSKKNPTGLAGYIDKNNCLSKKGIEKLLDVLLEFKESIENLNIKDIYPFATASLRNIENTEEVISRIKEKCDLDVEVISGTQEAIFDYYGTIQTVCAENGLVVDVGGGSTEIVLFQNKKIKLSESIPIGSLNLYNKFVSNIIPTQKESERIVKEISKRIKSVKIPNKKLISKTIYSVGGSARATLKLINDLNKFPSGNKIYDYKQLKKLTSSFENNNKKVVRKILKIAPERIHTIIPGILVFKTISKVFDTQSIITSDYGVREGYLYYVLKEKGIINY